MATDSSISSPAFVVFYSWQSDLPDETNRALIREALRTASTQLEISHPGAHVVTDEATRNMPGSPNIPQTILDKIRAADAFVADITTINKTRPDGQRACSNPNVLFELGYAVAHLGWGRIILLFNKAHGDFPGDAPFDVDRHRLSDYSYSIPTSSPPAETRKQKAARLSELKHPLFGLLSEALEAIFTKRPPKPSKGDELAPEHRKHQHDTEKLTTLLTSIHLPTLDDFFEGIRSGTIPGRIMHFWEGFNGIVTSNLFHLYDPTARSLVEAFHRHWGESLNFGQYFHLTSSGQHYSFSTPGDIATPDQAKAWKEMQRVAHKAHETLRGLLGHVREHYLDIDVSETSTDAWHEYVDFQNEMRQLFDKKKPT